MATSSSPFTPGSPAAEGFRMPAEWERHEATWLTWPHDEAHWTGMFDRIPRYWVWMAKELSAGEDVHILAHDASVKTHLEELLREGGAVSPRIHVHIVPNNFPWIRDHGPISIKNDATGEVRLLNWQYNAWGKKWAYALDNDVPNHIARITGKTLIDVPMVLEGGSIDVNGRGTVLTTEACLLNENRNAHLSKEEIEQHLKDYLGVTHVLWLGEGIAGDDTDGHVDDLTRFVGPRTVVTMVEEDPASPNYAPLRENVERLKHMTDQDGQALDIIPLPMPQPFQIHGEQMPASYANFYIGNASVLLPTFGDAHDQRSIETLQQCFPERSIVSINTRDLIYGLGSFHCLTQQCCA